MGPIFPELLRLRREAHRLTVRLVGDWYEEDTKAAFSRWLRRLEDELKVSA